VSQTVTKARHEMWFDGENKSLNGKFTKYNILVKGMSILLHNYRIMSFHAYHFNMLYCLIIQISLILPGMSSRGFYSNMNPNYNLH
jgi:hypothetical protein